MNRKSMGKDKAFDITIMVIMGLIAIMFLIPLINVLASSFSSPDAIITGKVGLFPVGFTLSGYKAIFSDGKIWNGFKNTLIYTVVGTVIQVSCQMLCAYPLSRSDFKGKKIINLILVLTMFISGGMIPMYLLINSLHLYNTVWAIILPGCISVFNIIVIRTYMTSNISKEVQEAAMIDGCGDFAIFFRIVIPLCKPIIAVMILYAVVGYWNNYFNALMYVQNSSLYPLQNVLYGILISNEDSLGGGGVLGASEQLKYVTIVVSSVPLLVIYPFFQKYFEKGVTIGGVKG